jgi:hypothetical protein
VVKDLDIKNHWTNRKRGLFSGFLVWSYYRGHVTTPAKVNRADWEKPAAFANWAAWS